MSENQSLLEAQEITWFWEDVTAEVKETLTPTQRVAIEDAIKKSSAQAHPADLRLYLGPFFVRIIAGKERRNRDRLKQDLKSNPIFAGKNAAVIAVFWLMMLLSTLYIGSFLLNIFGGLLFR